MGLDRIWIMSEIETPKIQLRRRQNLWVISESIVYVSFSTDKFFTPLSDDNLSCNGDYKNGYRPDVT